jgi:hypothetical protein
MKLLRNALSALFALGLVGAQLLVGSGCAPADTRTGLPESMMFEYDVAPEAVDAFEAAADRIAWASGVVLVNVPGGTPVEVMDDSPQGSCADTYVSFWTEPFEISSVFIDLYTPRKGCYDDLGDTLLHELIHSLRRYEDTGHPNHGHSETGVFQAVANKAVLNEDSLNKICEAVTCTQYNPEE